MRCRVIPYEGAQPYIFLSYCHQDNDLVYPLFQQMAQQGCRLWYDDGNHGGDDWLDNIEEHLEKCGAMVAFISSNSSLSHNCKKEMAYAFQLEKKVVPVLVDTDKLPKGLRMQLSYLHYLKRSDYASDEALLKKILKTQEVQDCKGEPGSIALAPEESQEIPSLSPEDILRKQQEEAERQQLEAMQRQRAEEERKQLEKKQHEQEEAERRRKEEEARLRQLEWEKKYKEEERLRQEAESEYDALRLQLEKELQRMQEELQRMAEEKCQREKEYQDELRRWEENERLRQEKEKQRQEAERKQLEEAQQKWEEEERQKLKEEQQNREEADVCDTDQDNTVYDKNEEHMVYEEEDPCSENDCTIRIPKKTYHSILLHPRAQKAFALYAPQTKLGRSPFKCDVLIGGNNSISKLHAEIRFYEKKLYLVDLDSANGTFIQDQELKAKEPALLDNPAFFQLNDEQLILLSGNTAAPLLQLMKQGQISFVMSEATAAWQPLSGDTMLLNRSHAWPDGTLKDPRIHRAAHAKLCREANDVYLVDGRPTNGNGVYLNEEEIAPGQRHKLTSGDQIRLGNTTLRYVSVQLEEILK